MCVGINKNVKLASRTSLFSNSIRFLDSTGQRRFFRHLELSFFFNRSKKFFRPVKEVSSLFIFSKNIVCFLFLKSSDVTMWADRQTDRQHKGFFNLPYWWRNKTRLRLSEQGGPLGLSMSTTPSGTIRFQKPRVIRSKFPPIYVITIRIQPAY